MFWNKRYRILWQGILNVWIFFTFRMLPSFFGLSNDVWKNSTFRFLHFVNTLTFSALQSTDSDESIWNIRTCWSEKKFLKKKFQKILEKKFLKFLKKSMKKILEKGKNFFMKSLKKIQKKNKKKILEKKYLKKEKVSWRKNSKNLWKKCVRKFLEKI